MKKRKRHKLVGEISKGDPAGMGRRQRLRGGVGDAKGREGMEGSDQRREWNRMANGEQIMTERIRSGKSQVRKWSRM